MNISPISFGKKIPVMNCRIKDTDKNKNIPAVISEYDCRTFEDAQDVINLGSDWHYYLTIGADMLCKYRNDSSCGEKLPLHFYVMKNNSGNTVALCETVEENDEIKVKFLESSHDWGHKYCGKTMLAALGKKLLENKGKRLVISCPLPSARDFYVKGCGFKDADEGFHNLQMTPEQVDEFVSQTERQAGGKITKPNRHFLFS